MSLARIFISSKRAAQMDLCFIVFATAVIRETQGDVCRRETGIAFYRLFVSGPSFAFLALLIEGQTVYVRLLGTAGTSRIGDRPCGRPKVTVTIYRRIGLILYELSP